jgi:hypothetical protein
VDVFRVRLVVEDFPAALRLHFATPGVTLVCFGDDVDAAVEPLVRAGARSSTGRRP